MDVLAESTGGPSGAQLIFLLGLGLVIVVLLVRSRRYFRQVTQYQVPTARPVKKSEPIRASAAPPRDYEKWEVAMHELARELSGQLDSKSRVLELLIREANEAAARLEAAVGGAKSAKHEVRSAKDESVSRGSRAALSPQTHDYPPEAPHKTIAGKPSKPSSKPFKIAGNPRFERVYALADAGMSPTTIANQIGSQVGEVELILSLRSGPTT
ncbi:MAG TPA: hypothetical protein VG056_11940 [Pirellulales bacterium]|jgi:hypothetical protein|nr:hypothetical protein [Pirellulales bacterium]